MWRFAEEFILGQIDEDLALWESSTNVCTVRQGVEGWIADWPDEAHRWSGDASGISEVKREWDQVLASTDLDVRIEWLMPEPQPLWFIASWVNVELTKNLAEINQVKGRLANATQGADD